MKKLNKITAALLIAAIPFALLSCNHNNEEQNGKSDPKPNTVVEEKVPEDAMRNWTIDSESTEWSVYGVADLEKLAEVVNDGNDLSDSTITVKNDIVINKSVLTKDFEEPAEGAEPGTPNPNLKNLESIGRGESPEGGYDKASFGGTFDGNGKVISGLYMYQGHQGLGFFGVVDGATIKNVILVDACVINRNMIPNPDPDADYPHDNKDDDRFGGLVGLAEENGVEIENCLFAGVVGSEVAQLRGSPYEYIGGLIGRATADSKAKDCFVFARIYGSHEDAVCGKQKKNETKEYFPLSSRDNLNGDGKGVEVKTFDEDIAADIADAILTVKENVQ